ncbi:AAA family ATPase [uncultured Veillonella sp.]|uniref:AAA family ATPase n=1 Tax=uncultured Veillonella sp. TaxID=159268 RepID=UPI0025E1DF23|nr:AAA family ATPase [uncultured Veillonella sp.]MDY3974800.1 AAA family ATPase [Veillonella caviae]
MGRIIAIMSGKGGVGKTTLTASLGAALNRAGHKVLITDADFGMRDLDLVVGKENDIFFDAIDIWKENCTSDYAILPLSDNFDFLPATQSRRWEDVGRKGYAKLIKGLAKDYDYVIIDAPAGIGRGNEAIFKAADQIVLVAEPIWVSLRAVQRVMQMCREVRQLNYMVVLNNVGHSKAEVPVEEALVSLQVEHLGTILPYRHMIQSWSQEGLLHEAVDSFFDHMMKALVKAIVADSYMEEEELLSLWRRMEQCFVHENEISADSAKTTEPVAIVTSSDTVDMAEGVSDAEEGQNLDAIPAPEGANTADIMNMPENDDDSAVMKQSEVVNTVEDMKTAEDVEIVDGKTSPETELPQEKPAEAELQSSATQSQAVSTAVKAASEEPVEEKKKGGLASLLRRQLSSLWSRRGRMR